jgi:16S rRNA (cytosine967-C5)-methyltransferase
VAIVEERLLNPGREMEALGDLAGAADAVLVDAPCSGTGTWRRNPEARWRLSEKELARLVDLQARLIELGAGLVKAGGRLVFVTCSLLDAEGAGQVADFLARHPGEWRAEGLALGAGAARGDGLRLEPLRDGTDGFFVARLQRL